jgi:hypothetical protein
VARAEPGKPPKLQVRNHVVVTTPTERSQHRTNPNHQNTMNNIREIERLNQRELDAAVVSYDPPDLPFHHTDLK